MRFVVAIVLFLVAFLSIGYGIAQRTILAGPASFTVGGDHRVDGADHHHRRPDPARLRGQSEPDGVGQFDGLHRRRPRRPTCGRGWARPATTASASARRPRSSTAKLVAGRDSTAPSPVGSDLWVDEFSGKTQLIRTINVPDTASVIIMADGKKAAPSHISITWPLDNSAPWSGPLIIGGIAALLAGLIAFLWALVHARRRSGPRRKQPRNPKPPQLKRGRTGTQPALEAPTAAVGAATSSRPASSSPARCCCRDARCSVPRAAAGRPPRRRPRACRAPRDCSRSRSPSRS